jgi:hypothetical protein
MLIYSDDEQVDKILEHADKEDQIAFSIVEQRFEKKYARKKIMKCNLFLRGLISHFLQIRN